MKEHEDLASLVKNVMETFSKDFFSGHLDIPEEDISNFVYYCAEFLGLATKVSSRNELELMEDFGEMALQYKNSKEE